MEANQFASDKILKHCDRIAEWQTTGVTKPIIWELDMTNVCNNKCPWCFGYAGERNTATLSYDVAIDILKQIRNFGARAVTFTGGGEPLCNPVTLRVVQYARDLGLDVGFITNGLKIDWVTADILVNACTWVRVSLDAGDAKTHEWMHGVSSSAFDKVINGITELVKAEKRNGATCTIGVGYLTCNQSLHSMEAATKLCKRLGVSYIQFRPRMQQYVGQALDYDSNQLRIRSLLDKCQSYGTRDFNVLCSKHKYECIETNIVRKYPVCYGHNFAGVICADQKVYLCCHFRGVDDFCFGDLREFPLAALWTMSFRKDAIARIDLAQCPPLCRCDGMNEILYAAARLRTHANFL